MPRVTIRQARVKEERIRVNYVTARKYHNCFGCKETIRKGEDYYSITVDVSMCSEEGTKRVAEHKWVMLSSMYQRFHTECFDERDMLLEAKKAKQHFKKL